jgi:hypothetical protein
MNRIIIGSSSGAHGGVALKTPEFSEQVPTVIFLRAVGAHRVQRVALAAALARALMGRARGAKLAVGARGIEHVRQEPGLNRRVSERRDVSRGREVVEPHGRTSEPSALR